MRTNSAIVDATTLEKLERKHLEADWRRAWESCSHAAQAGDYAEAEHWYQRAILLARQLATAEHARSELRTSLAAM